MYIYIVMRQGGSYYDYCTTPIAAYCNRDAAELHCENAVGANGTLKKTAKLQEDPSTDIRYYKIEYGDNPWDKYLRILEHKTSYYLEEVELLWMK